MRTGIFFIILALPLMILQGGIALGDSDSSANHVTIIRGGAASQGRKKIKNSKNKKKVAQKRTHTYVAKKASLKNKGRAIVAQKTTIVAPKPVVAVQTQKAPGRRATLANTDAAHANSYTNSQNTNLYSPRAWNSTLAESGQLGVGSESMSNAPALTTKIKKEEKQKSESYWEFQYKTNNAVNMNALENYGTGLDYTIAAWDRFYLTYYINKNISVGVVGQYYHTWFQDQNRPQSTTNPALTQTYASYLGDTGLALNDKKIATLAGGIDLSGTMAFYAPTSQASQTSGMYGQTRTGLSLGKSIDKVDLKWNETLWYDWQQYETNAYLSSSGTTMPNPQYYVLSNVDLTYNFTPKFSFTVESGFINETNYGDSYNGISPTNNDYIEVNPEFDYTFTKTFALALGIWEVYNTTIQPTVNGQPVSYYTPFAPYNGTSPGVWTASQLYLTGTVTF